nr:glycerol-3-phosphate 1-O-acyltransferase PlsY [Pseudomarimonas arenosa]
MLAYLLGSLSGSLMLGRLRGVDIRTQGSGNAGGTNAFRTQGWRFALGVVLVDVGKGALAVWLARQLQIGWQMELLVVLATVAGHVWPLFHGFRGGKGAATLVGGLAVIWPFSLPWLIGLWLAVLIATGYVGLATVLASWMLLGLVLVGGQADQPVWLGFALAVGLLISFTHRSNLQRLATGSEHRFQRARLVHRWLARRQ